MNHLKILIICLILTVSGAVMNAASDLKVIPGEFSKAWNVSYENFKEIEDLSNEEKDLLNYDIRIREEASEIIIKYIPRLLTDSMAKKLNRMVLGREVEYWISKKDFTIVKTIFYKA